MSVSSEIIKKVTLRILDASPRDARVVLRTRYRELSSQLEESQKKAM